MKADKSHEADILRTLFWLTSHENRFFQVEDAKTLSDFHAGMKPLIELSLVCYLLDDGSFNFEAEWARDMKCLISRRVQWERIFEVYRLGFGPVVGLSLLAFLNHEESVPRHIWKEALSYLDNPYYIAQERPPMREMDYQFTRKLLGLEMVGKSLEDQVESTILKRPFNPYHLDGDLLYDITHAIFYATNFGRDLWSPPQEISTWLHTHLGELSLGRYFMGDADLGAELALCRRYLYYEYGEIDAECVLQLQFAHLPDGSFRGPRHRVESSGLSDFEANYHTTLVAVVLQTIDLKLGHYA